MPRPLTRASLEVPIFGSPSASTAVLAGAARLELNAAGSYPAGGTTPTVTEIAAVNTVLDRLESSRRVGSRLGQGGKHEIPVRVMIRPRGPPSTPACAPTSSATESTPGSGPADATVIEQELKARAGHVDFQYSPAEIDTMEASIFALKPHLQLGRGDGFVFGALAVTSTNTVSSTSSSAPSSSSSPSTVSRGAAPSLHISIDEATCTRLVAAAQPFPCVFHRAFDLLVPSASSARSPLSIPQLLHKLKDLGFSGILTSGGVGNAVDNISNGNLPAIVQLSRSAQAQGAVGSRGAENGIDGIEVILGGGVRSGNVAEILAGVREHIVKGVGDGDESGSQWVHSSCLIAPGSEEVDVHEVARIVTAISNQPHAQEL